MCLSTVILSWDYNSYKPLSTYERMLKVKESDLSRLHGLFSKTFSFCLSIRLFPLIVVSINFLCHVDVDLWLQQEFRYWFLTQSLSKLNPKHYKWLYWMIETRITLYQE